MRHTDVPPVPWRVLDITAAGAGLPLFAFSGRYGYHRDELYYLVAGRHLAWVRHGGADDPRSHDDDLHQ